MEIFGAHSDFRLCRRKNNYFLEFCCQLLRVSLTSVVVNQYMFQWATSVFPYKTLFVFGLIQLIPSALIAIKAQFWNDKSAKWGGHGLL